MKCIITILLLSLSLILAQERCDNGIRCGVEAPCCSQFGYCGSTWEFCAAGCNHILSNNMNSCFNGVASPPPPPPIYLPSNVQSSDVIRCNRDIKCPHEAPCCSQFGFCGITSDYCHAGCNILGSYSPLACGSNGHIPVTSPNYYPRPPLPYPSYEPQHYPTHEPHPYPTHEPQHYPTHEPHPYPTHEPYPPAMSYPTEPWSLDVTSQPAMPTPNYMPQSTENWNLQGCSPFKEMFNYTTVSSKTVPGSNFNYGGPISFERNGLSLKMIQSRSPNSDNNRAPGLGGYARSKNLYYFGKFTAKLKTARVGGVVTAFNLISKDGDELDFEFVGHKENYVQSNYYFKGIQDYSKGIFSPLNFNSHYESHVYTIIWTKDYITYQVDGLTIRTVTKQSTFNPTTNQFHFPQSPMHVQFMLWDGGAGSPGTRDWAGGYINWNDQEIISNNGYIDMQVESFRYECL